jgi:hypothetical protein
LRPQERHGYAARGASDCRDSPGDADHPGGTAHRDFARANAADHWRGRIDSGNAAHSHAEPDHDYDDRAIRHYAHRHTGWHAHHVDVERIYDESEFDRRQPAVERGHYGDFNVERLHD